MVLDRREPAVYISVEDASYQAETIEDGRTTFGVILSDRGEHNKLLKITSQAKYQKLFGEPNYKKVSNTHYQLNSAVEYGPVLVCRVVPDGSTMANCQIKEKSEDIKIQHLFFFTENSKIVTSVNKQGIEEINIGEWVYAEHDGNSVAQQVVSKVIDENQSIFELHLASEYEGTTTTEISTFETNGANLYKFIPYVTNSMTNLTHKSEISTIDPEICYTFYAKGAGPFYNNLVIRAYRNTEFEKMYLDKNDQILYPYMFAEIAVYHVKSDESEQLLEGPWTVSLTPKTSNGEIIRDINTGRFLYIENIINESSEYIRCVSGRGIDKLSESANATERRKQVMSLMAFNDMINSSLVGMGVGLNFENGIHGDGLYDSAGNINPSDELLGKIAQAYRGDLPSVDGSIEQLREFIYPFVQPDYIVSGGFPAYVQEGARYLAALRQDCIHLADTGYKLSPDADLEARQNEYPWNNWTSALYTQYRDMFDIYTGNTISMSPVLHAIQRHLIVDRNYFLAEPVANINKGNINDQIELAYHANHTRRGDLQDNELNFVIKEPQGQYILTQLSTWKQMSVLKQLHVCKFIAFLNKEIPPLLKDILQHTHTSHWNNQAHKRIRNFLNNFVERSNNSERYNILKTFSANVKFDETRSEMNVYLSVTPRRTIQRINVFIIVQ